MAPKITIERTATTRDIRSDESSLCYCLDYVTSVSWRRVVAILGTSRRSVSGLHYSYQNVCDESWLWHWTIMLRLECMWRVVASSGWLIVFVLDSNAERRVMAFWHGLAMTHFFPLELVWLDLFTSFRSHFSRPSPSYHSPDLIKLQFNASKIT